MRYIKDCDKTEKIVDLRTSIRNPCIDYNFTADLRTSVNPSTDYKFSVNKLEG